MFYFVIKILLIINADKLESKETIFNTYKKCISVFIL